LGGPNRLHVLDGWRGISITCVLAGHMLPLGPKPLQFNEAVAATGMSLFFTLSGFLIVSMLVKNDNVVSFIVRRVCRIVPLAWAFLFLVLIVNDPDWSAWKANLLFYANLPPFYLDYTNGHFWSLCVEMQFYAAIAIVVTLAARRGLWLVPFACVAVTVARISYGIPISIVTWWRIDEILVGGCLALAYNSRLFRNGAIWLPSFMPFLLAPLLLASSHPAFGALNYGRPYFAALLIGSTIFRAPDALQRLLCGRVLGYLAEISYALYVVHPLTYSGWLGQGDTIVRYIKRVGSFFLTFLFAHLSTRHYEKHFIGFGHRLASWIEGRSGPRVRSVERADALQETN
jgi:peptidoglycan/LPS O-acetylase OafA/YrhL